jgi:hypothetical protein
LPPAGPQAQGWTGKCKTSDGRCWAEAGVHPLAIGQGRPSRRFAWHANRVLCATVVLAAVVQLGELPQWCPGSRCDRLRDQRLRDHPAIMAGVRKVAKTGTAAACYSRTAAAVPGPLILAKDGQSPSPARAELAFHRTRDATCRSSTRWPRGGLSRAGPCTPRRRTAMPPAGLAEWQGKRRR